MARTHPFSDVVISGVGMTEFSRESGVAEVELTSRAIALALADAGLSLDDVDGLSTFSLDANEPLILSHMLHLGDLSWFSTQSYGGGQACATVQDAALAVATGLAEVVVVYRGANMRSGHRFGQVTAESLRQPWGSWSQPYGLLLPSHRVALWFHRYMTEHGLTNADLAPISVSARNFAATNPAALFFERPLTIEEHQEMPWVAEPVLRMADCCLETDAGAALVVTTREKSKRSSSPSISILGAARGMARGSTMIENVYGTRADLPDMALVGDQLWRQSGMTPSEIGAAIIYDSFTPVILVALESLGFCSTGEAAGLIADGWIGRGGDLPVNPNGGQLAEAYVHGFNGMIEAVRQLRGVAVNQVNGVEQILCTAGTGLPSSGLILGA